MPCCKHLYRDYLRQKVKRSDIFLITLGVIHFLLVLQPDSDKDLQDPDTLTACIRGNEAFQRVHAGNGELHVTPASCIPDTYLDAICSIANEEELLLCEADEVSKKADSFCMQQRKRKEAQLPQDVKDAYLFGASELEDFDNSNA